MGLFQQLKHDVKTGLAKLRYGTVRAAHRALEETELLQLRLEVRKLDRRMSDLFREIGERAVEIHERGGRAEQLFHDPDILRAVKQIELLRSERDKLTADMEDVRSGPTP
jgi:hypothetical protein